MANYILLTIGKTKNKAYQELEEDYFERLKHYTPCEHVILKDSRQTEIKNKIQEESQALLKKIKAGDYVILLDEKGNHFTSKQLADEIQKINNRGVRRCILIIGGAYGVSEELKKRSQAVWSLSTLTLPHELSRVTLLEQLYRAHTILKGEKYHH